MATEEEKTEVTEEIIDQHGATTPEGFAEAMDEALKESDVEDTSEEEAEADEEIASEEADTDDEIIEEEAEESEDEAVDGSEELEEEGNEEEAEPEKKAKPEPARKTDDVVSEEREEIKFDLDPDIVDPQVKKALDKAAEVLNEQQKSIDIEKASLKAEREKAYETRVDSCFDSYEKDLPRLGGSSKLTEDNGKYRRRIFQHAHITAQMDGVSIEEAIKHTVRMFKNQDGEKTAKKAIITNLQKQKKNFTNPPTRKKSSPKNRKFKNETEKANFVMDEAYKKAGII